MIRNTTVMKLLFAALLFVQSSFAQAPKRPSLAVEKIIFNPQKAPPGRFIVAYKDYQDIRIDSDFDGQMDLWIIRKGPLELEIGYEKGAIRSYYIKKIIGSSVQEVLYKNERGTLKLKYSKSRSIKKWAFEEGEQPVGVLPMSADAETSSFTEAATPKSPELINNLIPKSFKDSIHSAIEKGIVAIKNTKACPLAENSAQGAKSSANEMEQDVFADFVQNNAFDPSCDSVLNSTEKRQLIRNFVVTVYDDDKFVKCMESAEVKKAFESVPEDATGVEKMKAQYALKVESFKKGEQIKPLFKCNISDNEKNFKSIEATENKQIIINKLKDKSAAMDASSSKILHELIHLSGVEDENLVKAVQWRCDGSSKLVRVTLNDDRKGTFGSVLAGNTDEGISNMVVTQSADTAKGASREPAQAASAKESVPNSKDSITRTIASESPVNMQQEMAVAQVATPDSSTLSQMISSPPPSTDEGAVAAVTRSASETNSTLRMANNLIGTMSTPSIASESLAKVDTSSLSSSSKTTKAELGDTRSVTNNSNNFATLSRSTLKSDERVVESITLDGSSKAVNANTTVATEAPTQTKAQAPEARNQRSPASSELASSTPSRGGGVQASSSGGRSSLGSSSSDSSSGSTFNPQSNEEPVSGSKSRAPASVPATASATNTATSSAPAREEVITYVSNGSYSTVKSKLKDNNFSKQLETQKITILDLYGNSYGAKKGDVIFLDQGDRFVRQK